MADRSNLVYSQEVEPGVTVTIEQWAVRYEDDGQIVPLPNEEQAVATTTADPNDPCLVIKRTVTITATEWSER